MLAEHKLNLLKEFIGKFSKEELIWVNGYLDGVLAPKEEATPEKLVSKQFKKITIAYGTETGNAKKLATGFTAKAKKNGVHAKLVGLDQYRVTDLQKEEYFITIISTQGEGEPPIAAQKFYDHLYHNGVRVPALKYAVLALGDTSYPLFCKTGEDVDSQLEVLGAKRFYPLEKCDLDYEIKADEWFSALLESLNRSTVEPQIVKTAPAPQKSSTKKIYTGTVLASINLNATGSSKTTYHIELETEAEFLPGDSIGIVPSNDSVVVERILVLSKLDPSIIVAYKNEELSVRELLISKVNLGFLLEKFVQQYAQLISKAIPPGKLDLLELLARYGVPDQKDLIVFLTGLHPIAPRIYNISSSPSAHGTELHIIALKDQFETNGIIRTGVCSTFLEQKKAGDKFEFFIQTNKRFRLPEEDKDVVMFGPGTGIAPFRSFVAERDATGASGRNWLFFGEDKFTTDFYYQTEWQNWFATGVLTDITLSFKDGPAPLSFTKKILTQSAELFRWIEKGAYVYLCGEKDPMGKNVEAALLQIISEHGQMDSEAASKYFELLKSNGRFVKDLY